MSIILSEGFHIPNIQIKTQREQAVRTLHYYDRVSAGSADRVLRKAAVTLEPSGPPVDAIRYLHVRHEDEYLSDTNNQLEYTPVWYKGGATIAYALEKRAEIKTTTGPDLLLVHAAVAVVHPDDHYVKSTGRAHSAYRLTNAKSYHYLVFPFSWFYEDTAPVSQGTTDPRWVQFSLRDNSSVRQLLRESLPTPYDLLAGSILFHHAAMSTLVKGDRYQSVDCTEVALDSELDDRGYITEGSLLSPRGPLLSHQLNILSRCL